MAYVMSCLIKRRLIDWLIEVNFASYWTLQSVSTEDSIHSVEFVYLNTWSQNSKKVVNFNANKSLINYISTVKYRALKFFYGSLCATTQRTVSCHRQHDEVWYMEQPLLSITFSTFHCSHFYSWTYIVICHLIGRRCVGGRRQLDALVCKGFMF